MNGSEAVPEGTRVRSIAVDDARWSEYVHAHPRGSVYHLPQWSSVLQEAYRWRPATLVVERDGRLRGVLPLVAKRGRLSGGRLRSLPVAPTAGPLGDAFEDECALVAAAVDVAAQRDLALVIESRTRGIEQHVPAVRAVAAMPSWVLEVPDDPDAWLRTRPRRLIRGVRRADRDGVIVRPVEDGADLVAFYELYLGTMRRHRHPPRSLSQLRAARERLTGSGIFHLTLAERAGRIVAGLQFHAFNDVVELLYNASDPSANDHRPNHALYMEAVRWARLHGYRRIDFGTAWPDTELAEFKRQWGAVPVPEVIYASHDAGTRERGPEGSTQRSRLHGWTDAAWDRTPLRATAAASTFAQRYL